GAIPGGAPPRGPAPRPGPPMPPPQAPARPHAPVAMPPAGVSYLVQLLTFAHQLEVQAHGGADATAIRLVRERLVQWAEDMTSVSNDPDMVAAIEALIARLSA